MYINEFIRKVSVEEFAKYIDNTILKPDASIDIVKKYIDDTLKYGFQCLVVNPYYVSLVRELSGGRVRIGTVVGFPLGACKTETKVYEAKKAIEDGVSEIDMVMNISAFKSGYLDYVVNDIKAVVDEAKSYGDIVVKVIIETGLLSDEEKVKAVELVVKAGADYVKTSTGFIAGGATVHDVRLLYNTAKGRVKVKASGGIRHVEDAITLILAGADRIGTSTGTRIIEEFIALRNKLYKE
ncbi:MAG TPA: deoxyribose-phosphate aldolase [Desulfurococcales archaeon]|nr:deoxyribose-phosphate aldolase [Desulfurococcales archaeon]